MKFKPPKLDSKKTYVMKRKDRDEFVAQLTPMMDNPYICNAHRFSGEWLNDGTCWCWWTFHEPVELEQAIKLYTLQPLKRVVRDRPVTKREAKKFDAVRKKVEKEFPPKHGPKKPVRRLFKKTLKRR